MSASPHHTLIELSVYQGKCHCLLSFALHHIVQEGLDQFAVLLGLIKIGQLHRAVDLRVTGGVGHGQLRQIVPVLRDLPVLIKAEDVEGDLLARTGEIVDRLEEHIHTVLEGADVVDRRFDRRGGQIRDRADKSVAAGAVGQIVLNIVLIEQGWERSANGFSVIRCA